MKKIFMIKNYLLKNVRKILWVSFISIAIMEIFFIGSSIVKASTPTLSISGVSGNSVQINVYGDPNYSIFLYNQSSNYGTQQQYIGTTNSSGYFSITVSQSAYNINPGNYVYVMVNNQQSSSVMWPYATGLLSISLSQNNLSLNIGQSQTVTIYGGYAPYSLNPSASNIFQSTINGNTITVIGQNSGSGSLNICASGNGCVVLYITVNSSNYNYGSQIYLSKNNISIGMGSNITVTVYGNGNYYISSNSNSNVASVNLSGSNVTVYGLNSGNTNITICQNYGQCTILYITVVNSYNYSAAPITFSQSNLNLPINQSLSVSIYGGSGGNYYSGNYYNNNYYYGVSYYVGYNSNPSSVQTSLNGSTLTLTGRADSATVIVVCSSSNSCGALTILVGSAGVVYGATYQQNWIFCSSENQFCNFSGTRSVRYGMNGSYYYQTFTNGVWCSNSVFGDPAFGIVKQCSYSSQ